MLDAFTPLKDLLKLDRVCIDNNVFRLHYKASVVILMLFSLLVTSKQYIGDPIDCIVDKIPPKVMDTYCWIHSTFTIPNLEGAVGKNLVSPGVGYHDEEAEVKHHKYYQWVCFALFFQAVLFYVPRYLWKTWEGGRLKTLCGDLNLAILGEDDRLERVHLVADYLALNFHRQNLYAYRFFLCEFLNFVNVVAQIYLVDHFLDGEFFTYGLDILGLTDRIDSMTRVFPKVTKCTFRDYGPSGTIQKYDGLCVIPVNVVNEKIYAFLWFWLVLLSVITALSLLFRAAVVSQPKLREVLLRARCASRVPKFQVGLINRRCRIGDWFVIYQLGKNVDPVAYKMLLKMVAGRLEGKQCGV